MILPLSNNFKVYVLATIACDFNAYKLNDAGISAATTPIKYSSKFICTTSPRVLFKVITFPVEKLLLLVIELFAVSSLVLLLVSLLSCFFIELLFWTVLVTSASSFISAASFNKSSIFYSTEISGTVLSTML